MNKVNQIIGIDISKDTFNAYSLRMGDANSSNNLKGFKAFEKFLEKESWCVMEATGSYHHQLATYLYEKGYKVSIVNPLVIKRFIQMKLRQTKTDKSDARMIALYGTEQPLQEWYPDPEYIEQCKMIGSAVNLYFKQSTALKNKLHSLESKGSMTGALVRSLKRQLKNVQKEIDKMEVELELLIKNNEGEMLTKLSTIPGIGRKTAMLLISSTNGFKMFENHNQVSSYFGLAPMERTSGSSVRGRSRITKTGDVKIRNHLFMCSFTACSSNKQCKALYDRIVAKGKSKKLALIAVSNKLLKQAYAIAKTGLEYDSEYRSVRQTTLLK